MLWFFKNRLSCDGHISGDECSGELHCSDRCCSAFVVAEEMDEEAAVGWAEAGNCS